MQTLPGKWGRWRISVQFRISSTTIRDTPDPNPSTYIFTLYSFKYNYKQLRIEMVEVCSNRNGGATAEAQVRPRKSRENKTDRGYITSTPKSVNFPKNRPKTPILWTGFLYTPSPKTENAPTWRPRKHNFRTPFLAILGVYLLAHCAGSQLSPIKPHHHHYNPYPM